MSNFFEAAYDPEKDVVRTAYWIDDYFGRYKYGVTFDEDGVIYHPIEVVIPHDVTFVREKVT